MYFSKGGITKKNSVSKEFLVKVITDSKEFFFVTVGILITPVCWGLGLYFYFIKPKQEVNFFTSLLCCLVSSQRKCELKNLSLLRYNLQISKDGMNKNWSWGEISYIFAPNIFSQTDY